MKRKSLLIVLLVAFASLLPAAYRTVTWGADAYGLTTLATLTDDEHSINPYSRNGIFVSPDQAAWILRSTDWPYERCSTLTHTTDLCNSSLIAAVGAFLDHPDEQVRERLYGLLHHFIERGEPVNTTDVGGVPLVHQAVLFGNERYLQVLIGAGADLSTRYEKGSASYDPYEFAQLLAERDREMYGAVLRLLDKQRNP